MLLIALTILTRENLNRQLISYRLRQTSILSFMDASPRKITGP